MLPSKDRLRSKEVEEVFEKGSRRVAPLFSIVFIRSADRTAFAIAASKKVAPNAVDRNKIRRKMYSALSKIKKQFTKSHVVFLPKREIIKTSVDVLEKEIKDILIRATILG